MALAKATNDELQAALDILGYSAKWLEYGLLSEAFLRAQVEEFATSGDKNTEHYRYGGFRSVLREHRSLGDDALAQYVELAQIDADIAMAGSALVDLIQWRGLTDEQFEWLSVHPAYDVPFLHKVISRLRLIKKLRSGPLTAALFEECLASGDSVTQRLMLEASSISRCQVGRLQEAGATRAIRNLAAVWLRRKTSCRWRGSWTSGPSGRTCLIRARSTVSRATLSPE